ncbi:superoxide dismutase [Psychroflexus sp. CAK8W]|uniref:Superoxide dismutase n=1 Tax=Psychroflexus longus TaxID=2873596 RepID=A0ABS7XIZ3_9FLAO|nr:superoxide dismutase [Psychroflexus longus]MBZ9778943.1 superoxide dismutase [Psychroflexus longus]
MERRKFISQTALVTAGIITAPHLRFSRSAINSRGKFKLPDLPYTYDALEPYIDEFTMRIHHGKHFQGYTDKLNKAIENTELKESSITEILKSVDPDFSAIRNNGGGYYNHKLFFESLSPKPKLKPEGELMEAIERDFGSYETFVDEFSKTAGRIFGSGWAWLIKDETGRLAVVGTANQDNPLMSFTKEKGIPLMGIDVWEHAYYLNYQNKRSDYIEAFFNILNWEFVENRYRQ